MQIEEYVEQISDAHGIQGSTVLPDGTIVFTAYRDGEYELCTLDEQLTETDGDITYPERLEGRESVVAHRDVDGNEAYDLVEVDPEAGTVTPILDDQFQNQNPQQNPTDPAQLAFVSTRDRSLDLYTLGLETGEVTKRSENDDPVWGYAWSPDGDALVYQSGAGDGDALRLIDLDTETDEVLVDEPDSEQSLSMTSRHQGRGAWSDNGIVFTTNHETGYRELAVADPSGDYDLHHVTEWDKYDPRWTPDGDIVFVEPRNGNREIRRLDDGEVETIESVGAHVYRDPTKNGVYYANYSPTEAGDLKKDGETVVVESEVDFPTTAPEEMTYKSGDGQEISARLYTPDEEPVGGIVNIHGGPPAQHYNRLDPTTQTLVQSGFEVLAPDYRGSVGYGREFRTSNIGNIGAVDVDDVAAGAAYLRERGRSQVGAIGASWGGYLTLMGASTTDAFDAGASICGLVNLETAVENARGYLGEVMERLAGGTPEEVPELYEERSPIAHVDDINVPLLVVQGANDPRVPQSEAEQLISSLEERDIPHEYLLFEDEGHGVVKTENTAEYLNRTVSLFETAFES
ncbi:S9 family peptidase [Halapricum desulfuricans]|uniref:Dipeptidyl aminopeptidase/acylaminoacyl-peptidase n=1 Tax=Halapricum desulfuricans TaxID=2841257 RepID=A0A897NAT9_9EURY|nr:alpha/beta fold hydrolase [Halapricum desulfuricans]QSG09564.1 Dipeptidyl aminopeptidase/acylaminoacyl-peptidase [Halapricum desulfuricans]